jgi:CRISPR-associated protein Cmr2
MLRDYYAFRQAELRESLSKLDRIATVLDDARKAGDKDAREKAENQLVKEAQYLVKFEPHLAYLWFWAKKEETEDEDEKRCASEAANAIRDAWQNTLISKKIPDAFHFIPDLSIINHMPPLSFIVRIPFRLQKPYISKDEKDFYLLDNPLRKEKIFQVPMVPATSWKGALRAALWQLGYKEEDDVTMRLLGNPRHSDEHQAGRLYFYSTFIENIGLEVINPHSRETGVGERGPILIECVPEGTGTLLILYVPFDPLEQSNLETRRDAVAQDLDVLAEGIQAMLATYGFGAKTSSGFGTAEDRLVGAGKLAIRAIIPNMAEQATDTAEPEPTQALPRYLESPSQLHDDFCRPDGGLKSESEYQALLESRGQKYTKKRQKLYKKAKAWFEHKRYQLAEESSHGAEPELMITSTKTLAITELSFSNLRELRTLAHHIALHLRNGGKA